MNRKSFLNICGISGDSLAKMKRTINESLPARTFLLAYLGISDEDAEEDKKDPVRPDHYRLYPMQSIVAMEGTFGTQATINFCYITAFKYRLRLGLKDEIQQELEKEKWYLDKAKELEAKLVTQLKEDKKLCESCSKKVLV